MHIVDSIDQLSSKNTGTGADAIVDHSDQIV